MIYIRHFLRAFIFLVLLVGQATAEKSVDEFYRNFWSPTYHIQRLSYCSVDGQHCGAVVANRYCRLMGYERSKEQIIAYNVGVTHYISSPARCVGWGCDGFMLITCEGKFKTQPIKNYYYRSHRFVDPRFNHYRIDWCYKNGQECGSRPANSFCRRMGYMKAQEFKKQEHVSATKAIGNQRLCFGPSCNSFGSITCFR